MARRRPPSIANEAARSEAPKLKAVKPPAPRRSLATAAAVPPQGTPRRTLKTGPTEEDIRRRAFLRYLDRGGADGELNDWLYAERELKKDR